MKDPTYPPTPELDRRTAIRPQASAVSAFLNWCDEQKIILSIHHEHQGSGNKGDKGFATGCWVKHECNSDCGCHGVPTKCKAGKCSCAVEADRICGRASGEVCDITIGREALLAKHFELDLRKIDKEQEAVLDWVRMTPEEREKAAQKRARVKK